MHNTLAGTIYIVEVRPKRARADHMGLYSFSRYIILVLLLSAAILATQPYQISADIKVIRKLARMPSPPPPPKPNSRRAQRPSEPPPSSVQVEN
ncbi:hypothetical protein CIPAW_15G137100 [Carya illinoinensis]|uniref:Uncharacterized protein n=1 Tax=Carya illinoinensis TaxID=32201 RepID=A0A8T1NEL7_CARIL|nr:hypothetical protein CIPAW_15G137100 [Carya illinoinensis]KAG6675779.1 hypothetical protein I3842_15G121500 [Carya illinoinensis]